MNNYIKLIIGTISVIILASCTHPIIEPADIIANKTIFPYTENLMNKYETDEKKKDLVKMQMQAFRRLVEEAKK